MSEERTVEALREAAAGWRQFGGQVEDVLRALDAEVRAVVGEQWRGRAAEVFDGEWRRLRAAVEEALPAFTTAGDALSSAADDAEEAARRAAREEARTLGDGPGEEHGGAAFGDGDEFADLGGAVGGEVTRGSAHAFSLEDLDRALAARSADHTELLGGSSGPDPAGGTGAEGASTPESGPAGGGHREAPGGAAAAPVAVPPGMQAAYVITALSQLGTVLGSTFARSQGGGGGRSGLARSPGGDASDAPRGASPFPTPEPRSDEAPRGGLGIAGGRRTPARNAEGGDAADAGAASGERPADGPDRGRHGAFG
ncbi:WXG100 family type VII secretion target [Streptomyces durbertensis]|uniref:WXG100 family type VII secretion target n=1 Tax=Streptomyces durbertensis TaxID=2448886 RepID=A0ABR6EKV9_9ACTN|nr:WXG100 family type VII secretion target [Streptomyces durbertensis]MBB1245973.1 WXG100 family type VII secretion target [Streptomyces durbertensis]